MISCFNSTLKIFPSFCEDSITTPISIPQGIDALDACEAALIRQLIMLLTIDAVMESTEHVDQLFDWLVRSLDNEGKCIIF